MHDQAKMNSLPLSTLSILYLSSAYDEKMLTISSMINNFLFHRDPYYLSDEELTMYQRAARYGDVGDGDCQYEYPCLVQPLDLLLYMYDYWYGEE